MTCVVGIVDGDRVLIGADSAGVSGYDVIIRADRKVFRVGDLVVGYTSSFRMGQLLAYGFDVPPRPASTDPFGYMVTTFVDAVRARLRDGGYARLDEGAENGGEFIVGLFPQAFLGSRIW